MAFSDPLGAFLDGLACPVIATDDEGRLLRFNAACEAVSGRGRDEVLGLFAWGVLADAASAEAFRGALLAPRSGAESEDFECFLQPPQGPKRLILWRFHALGRAAGAAVVATGEDVTDLRANEALLSVTRARLHHLLQLTPAAIYTCAPHGDFRATFMSPNVQRLLGYEAADFLSDPRFWVERVHPEDREDLFASLANVLQEGRHAHEYRFLHQDGTWRWIHDEVTLVRDPSGEPQEFVGYWIDVTEHHEAEAALLQSRERYRVLFERSPVAILQYDTSLRITESNERFATLMQTDRARYKGFDMSGLKDDRVLPALREALAGRDGFYEGPYRATVSPVELWIALRTAPLRDAHGVVTGGIATGEDLTQHRRAMDALRESEERLRIALMHSPLIVFRQDAGLRYTWISGRHPALPATRLLGRTDAEIFPSEEAALLTRLKREVIERGIGHREVVRLSHGGTSLKLDLSLEPLRDRDGQVAGLTGAALEVQD